MRKLTSRLFLAALGCLAFSGACGSDDPAPVVPVDYVPLIRQLDGSELGESVDLVCDGTLALSIQILRQPFADEDAGLKPVEAENEFVLRPANACGTASRCGYIRLEAFDEAGELVATTDTATTAGVLTFDVDAIPTGPIALHATLIRGYDQTKVVNADEKDAATDVSFTLRRSTAPCPNDGSGGAGAGGAPNEPVGGAGAGGAGGEPAAGGFGGATGGAGGESLGGAPTLPLGGAGAGGA